MKPPKKFAHENFRLRDYPTLKVCENGGEELGSSLRSFTRIIGGEELGSSLRSFTRIGGEELGSSLRSFTRIQNRPAGCLLPR